jgi:hypothetical protein
VKFTGFIFEVGWRQRSRFVRILSMDNRRRTSPGLEIDIVCSTLFFYSFASWKGRTTTRSRSLSPFNKGKAKKKGKKKKKKTKKKKIIEDPKVFLFLLHFLFLDCCSMRGAYAYA